MSFSNVCVLPKQFCVRRLLRQDIPQLCGLYTHFFAPNATPTRREVCARFAAGEFFGIFCGSELVCAATVLPLSARISPASEVRALKKLLPALPADTKLLCDIAFCAPLHEDAVPLFAQLFQFATTHTQRGGNQPVLCALLPVKTAAALVEFFRMGFALYTIRPFARLTPCYLLCRDENTPRARSAPRTQELSDTKGLCRLLEDGWRGYELQTASTLLLCKR